MLKELYVTVTRKLARPLSPEAAQTVVTHLSTFPLVPVDGATILRAIHLHQAATLSFWDALIVQTALESNCKRLLSEDLQHGRRFGELVVEDPFKDDRATPRRALGDLVAS